MFFDGRPLQTFQTIWYVTSDKTFKVIVRQWDIHGDDHKQLVVIAAGNMSVLRFVAMQREAPTSWSSGPMAFLLANIKEISIGNTLKCSRLEALTKHEREILVIGFVVIVNRSYDHSVETDTITVGLTLIVKLPRT